MRMRVALRLLLASAVGLVLAGTFFSSQSPPAQAQATLNQVTVHPLQQVVYEGGLAQFSVTEGRGHRLVPDRLRQDVGDRARRRPGTRQPDRAGPRRDLPQKLSRDVTLSVAVYNDEWSAREGDLRAEVQASPDNEYDVGSPSLAAIDVLSYYDDTTSPVVADIERVLPLRSPREAANDVQFRVRQDQGHQLRTPPSCSGSKTRETEAPGQPLGPAARAADGVGGAGRPDLGDAHHPACPTTTGTQPS